MSIRPINIHNYEMALSRESYNIQIPQLISSRKVLQEYHHDKTKAYSNKLNTSRQDMGGFP